MNGFAVVGLSMMLAAALPSWLASQQVFTPDVPLVWDDDAMSGLELPLASRVPVHHVPADYYYRIPTRPNLKTYPIYGPGKEPSGYWEWLLQQEPQPAFDPAALHSQEDWIKAGELVFEAPKDFTAFDHPFTDVRNPRWYEYTGITLDHNGQVPFFRYVIRKKRGCRSQPRLLCRMSHAADARRHRGERCSR